MIQHIEEVHGAFFLATSGGCRSAVCRICDFEMTGDHIRQHEEQHWREGFTTEEKVQDGQVRAVLEKLEGAGESGSDETPT